MFRLFAIASLSLLLHSDAEAVGPFRDRPCGPGISNLLVPQQYFGADFRPACRRHDSCYSSGASTAACNDRFQRDLLRACDRSKFKLGCRITARLMGGGTKLFGDMYRR